MNIIRNMRSEIAQLKLLPYIPGANELMILYFINAFVAFCVPN